MRIDRLLCFLRFVKTRSQAQRWVDKGHIRCNGVRVIRHGHTLSRGDVLTLPHGDIVRVIEILDIPKRRGPALEAFSCYRVLDREA